MSKPAKKEESEESSSSSSDDEEMKEEEVPIITSTPTVGVSSFQFKDSNFPAFNVTLIKSAAKSSIYSTNDVKSL
jgi:hypothetical protein